MATASSTTYLSQYQSSTHVFILTTKASDPSQLEIYVQNLAREYLCQVAVSWAKLKMSDNAEPLAIIEKCVAIGVLESGFISELGASARAPLPEEAFGAAAWNKYFGDVGKEPPLPADIETILSSPCPFTRDKIVKDTHVLVLVPKTVNGETYNLKTLGNLIRKPKETGNATQYSSFWDKIGEQTVDSDWVLMTRSAVIRPSTSYEEQVKELKAASQDYDAPSTLEAATAILMHHVRSGEQLFGDDNYTHCQECVRNIQAAVGSFTTEGLEVDPLVNGRHGLAGCRRLSSTKN